MLILNSICSNDSCSNYTSSNVICNEGIFSIDICSSGTYLNDICSMKCLYERTFFRNGNCSKGICFLSIWSNDINSKQQLLQGAFVQTTYFLNNTNHGQTLANRMKPGPSFQL